GHAVDHPGGEPGHDVGHRHCPRLKPVGLEPLHHAIVAGRRIELDVLEIVDGLHRLLREDLRPAAAAPVEEHEASGLDALADLRRELVGDVVQLVVRLEEERNVEDVEGRVDAAEADGGERRGLQRAEPHLAQDLRLVAHRAAGKHRNGDAAVGRRLPLVGHLLHVLVPHRALGHDGGELDLGLRLCGGGQREKNENVQRARHGLMRFADHSICPIPVTSALPLTMASPSRSPVNTTVIGPCGVCAVSVSFIALPSIVPITGASPSWLPNVPDSLPASSASVALAGKSPAGVLSVTSHLPPNPVPTAADDAGSLVVAAAGALVVAAAGAVVAAVASARFAVQSPSAKPPKSALPAIVSPATLPFILTSSGMPWKLIVKVNFTSSPSTVPLKASSPAGDLKRPSSFSASCFNVTFDVLAPWGELIVMSQSPVTSVCAGGCADAVTAGSRASARMASRMRIMTVAP